MKKSYVRKIAAKLLLPRIAGSNFIATKDGLGGFRVRGDFVDVIGLQIGGGAESVYLHYFMNLIADPFADTLNSYRVGKRLKRHPSTELLWHADSEDEMFSVMESVTSASVDCAIPFFDQVEELRDFVVEIVADPQRRLYDFDLAIALAGLGYSNKVYWICESVLEKMASEGNLGDEDASRRAHCAKTLRSAAQSGRMKQVLADWRQKKLRELGLAEESMH